MMCIGIGGVIAHKSSSSSTRCLMEGLPRSRPHSFGATIPNITTRGQTYVTTRNNGSSDTSNIDINDRDNCPMCKKFSKGPCGNVFKRWLACTDEYPGKDANGEPIHLDKCSAFAESLAKCLDENTEYYTKEDMTTTDKHDNIELTDAWIKFVNTMESGIESGKYSVIPFPEEEVYPQIQISLATRAAAVFFNNNQEKIIAAYILDDNGKVIAAGSKEDINIEGLGCVLQFKVNDGLKYATCRAIYDIGNNEDDDVVIYSRKVLIQ